MKPSMLHEALHALTGQRVPMQRRQISGRSPGLRMTSSISSSTFVLFSSTPLTSGPSPALAKIRPTGFRQNSSLLAVRTSSSSTS